MADQSIASSQNQFIGFVRTKCRLSLWLLVCFVNCVFSTGCNKQANTTGDLYGVRKEIVLDNNHMAFIVAQTGCALIDLLNVNSTSVDYRWRYWRRCDGPEQDGKGRACERISNLFECDGTAFGVDCGTDFALSAGGVHLLWTPKSSQSIWLFFLPEKTAVAILPDSQFDSFVPNTNGFTNVICAGNQIMSQVGRGKKGYAPVAVLATGARVDDPCNMPGLLSRLCCASGFLSNAGRARNPTGILEWWNDGW